VNGGGDTKWYVLWIAYCFFYLFFKKCRLSKFCFFFLSIITFNYVTWETDFHQTFSRASVNNEINWKLEGTNRKWHAKPTNYFFIKDKFLKFFCFFTFFNNLASNIISFLLKKTPFFSLVESRALHGVVQQLYM
jgi:hypothetical protein